jgi:hypothetical protein
VKINCGGSPPKEDYSRSSHSFTHWLVLKVVVFPRRESSGHRLLQGWLFLHGRRSRQDPDLG